MRPALAVLMGAVGVRAADRVRQRRQPAARAHCTAANATSRCARRSAPAARGWCGSCWSRARCWPSPAARWASPSARVDAAAADSARARSRSRGSPTRSSTAACWRFRSLLSVATAFLFGLLPAIRASRIDLQASLHGEGRKTVARANLTSRAGCWSPPMSRMAVVLLIGAGLMIKSVGNLLDVNPGFDADHVLTMQISMVGDGVREGRGRRREDRPDDGRVEGAAGRRVRCRRGADSARRQRRHVGLPHRRPPVRAAGSERRTLFGDARILLGDAHPAAPRPPVHGRRIAPAPRT